MRYEKTLKGKELLQKPEWSEVKGIYNEYGLERTFCGCGYVTDKRIYVCPDCGNTTFVAVKDFHGHIKSCNSEDLTYVRDGEHDTLQRNVKWLKAKRDPSDPAVMLLSEEERQSVCFSTGTDGRYYDVTSEELMAAFEANFSKFTKNFQRLIKLLEPLDIPAREYCRIFKATDRCSSKFQAVAKELIEGGEKNLLKHLAALVNVDWTSVDTAVESLHLPAFLLPERNNPTILALSNHFDCYGWRTKETAELEARWNKLPMDIQQVILLYLRQGLITVEQLQKLPFIDDDLLKNYPDVQAKILKKYFANFTPNTYSWRRTSPTIILSEMKAYYDTHGLPILPGTFDLRVYCSMLNTDIVKAYGFSEADVDKALDKIEEAPLDTILAFGQMRRPRKKKTP